MAHSSSSSGSAKSSEAYGDPHECGGASRFDGKEDNRDFPGVGGDAASQSENGAGAQGGKDSGEAGASLQDGSSSSSPDPKLILPESSVCGSSSQTGDLDIPNVCPRCYSTALIVGLEICSCQICNWTGTREELLGVASSGLTLEDKVAKFTQDLLGFFHAAVGDKLSFFLTRWGVVDGSKEQLRIVTAQVIGRMASGVLQYCMGDDTEDDATSEVNDINVFIERAGTGIGEYLLRLGMVDPKSPDFENDLDVVIKELRDRIAARCLVECSSAENEKN